MEHTPSHFDNLFFESDDPWQFRSRWYEQRKRDLTLACLPRRRYQSAYEPGCANGELSAALATRCDRLLVSDGSVRAVALARQRLAGIDHVEVRHAWLPSQWPTGLFDLVVMSELGYFLSSLAFDGLADRALASLGPGGTLLACHWRRTGADCELDGDEVHRRLEQRLGLARVGHWVDDDFRLDVWCRDARSVAQQEGFA